jgi:hypothetical protein
MVALSSRRWLYSSSDDCDEDTAGAVEADATVVVVAVAVELDLVKKDMKEEVALLVGAAGVGLFVTVA